MVKSNLIFAYIFLLVFNVGCSRGTGWKIKKSATVDLEWLNGKWKQEGKEVYEEWTEVLKGEGYHIVNGEKRVFEQLEIGKSEKGIFYKATVFGQNEGEGINFYLVSDELNKLVFENREHDFPNRIIYQLISPRELLVIVGGLEGNKLINAFEISYYRIIKK